jgi:hypothetical protein
VPERVEELDERLAHGAIIFDDQDGERHGLGISD